MSRARTTALQHWGEDAPPWVLALADACDLSSQNAVARRLGRSASLISTVLRKKYPGDMNAVEERVRGAFMNETVACPAIGAMPMHECQDWQVLSRGDPGANPERRRMLRACNRCPRNRRAET
jgi:hypothetical protein